MATNPRKARGIDPVRGREGSQRASASNGVDRVSGFNILFLKLNEATTIDLVIFYIIDTIIRTCAVPSEVSYGG